MQRKKVLITGIVCLAGKYIVDSLSKKYTLYGFYHKKEPNKFLKRRVKNLYQVDISDTPKIQMLIKRLNPDVCIHLAALSNIDYCEKHMKESYFINVTATKNLCKILEHTHTHFIFMSSNAIFSGNNPPYSEDAKPAPRNFYGKTKVEAENVIQKLLPTTSSIIRCTSLYGWSFPETRSNDVPYYTAQLKKKGQLHLVNDRFFNPIHAETMAKGIAVIIAKKKFGTYHFGGIERVSRYTFVQQIISSFKITPKAQIIPELSTFFLGLAERPYDAVLNNTKMKSVLGIIPNTLNKELLRMKNCNLRE